MTNRPTLAEAPTASTTAKREAPPRRAAPRGAGVTVWLTGLSGAGKSTLAEAAAVLLEAQGIATAVLDGDELRRGLCRDLGFSPEDRRENIRRAAAAAELLRAAGLVVFAAFISPYRDGRRAARALAEEGARRAAVTSSPFVEVWVKAPLSLCEARDVKGLYRRARDGEILEFTGVSAPYEEPEAADLVVDTSALTVGEAAELLVTSILTAGSGRGGPRRRESAVSAPRRAG